MRKHLMLVLLTASTIVSGKTFYVATNGSDLHPGTISQPWGTWQKAFNTAKAGDTVYFRGGVWYPTTYAVGNAVTYIAAKNVTGVYTGQIRGNDGTRENPVCFFAYPPDYEAGNYPILDCSQVAMAGHYYNVGISIYVTDWLHFKGLAVRNVYQPTTPDPGFNNQYQVATGIGTYVCSNLTFENMIVHDVGGRAFSGAHVVGDYGIESDTTRWINCDAYNCIDSLSPEPGNAADGWKIIGEYANEYKSGGLFEFIGCRAWNCSDDGFDPSGSIKVIFDNCWAFYNGHYGPVLDGNGFKSGGVFSKDILSYPTRIIKNCLAAYNVGYGIYDLEYAPYRRNNSRIYNNTIYKNGIGIHISSNENYPNSLSVYNNNIIYGTTQIDAGGRPYHLAVDCFYTESHNTWDYGKPGSLPRWVPTDTVTVTDADFISLDSTGIRGRRKADGSLPDIDFLKLAAGSDLIDAGINVGLPYSGSAPDLGYAEYGAVPLTPASPAFVIAVIQNASPDKLEMTYSLSLAAIVPANSAFIVMVNNQARTVNAVAVAGNKVTLTLASPVAYGDVVTVAYNKPATNPLQTPQGGQAQTMTARNVTNNVAAVIPVFNSAVIQNASPDKLEMTYSLSLAAIVPANSAFIVMVNNQARTVNAVTIAGNKVTLTLASPVAYGDVVTVAYNKPATNPLQTPQGGQAQTMTARNVINNVAEIPNQPPFVSISSPTKNTGYIAPATITIEAHATDSDGTIAKVEFYNGQVRLGEVTKAPYLFKWKNVPEGNYLITAVATDNNNARTVSDPVTIVVNKSASRNNQSPFVRIKSPDKGKVFKKSESIILEAEASDSDGTISKIEFMIGDKVIAVLTEAPWIFNWQNADAGQFLVTAIATDNLGAVSQSSEVDFTVYEEKNPGLTMLSLYPNPNEGHFKVEMAKENDSERLFTVYSLSGQALYNEKGDGHEVVIEFNLSELFPGTYILAVSSDNKIIDSRKFTKK